MRRITLALAAAMSFVLPFALPAAGQAEEFDSIVTAELRPGWRLANGDHMAALTIQLAPGWKTYWRAPGDAGIPPQFNWRGGQNARGVAVMWPAPEVFHQSGMRSVGYHGTFVLPLRVTVADASRDATLTGVIDIGVCSDVCVPQRLSVTGVLPVAVSTPDSAIAAALANAPFTARDAGVGKVRCVVSPNATGMALRAEIDMPRTGRAEETVIETADPEVWVAEPKTWREGNRLMSETRLVHVNGGPFALDRSGVRITVLGGKMAVDIQGCSG